MKSRFLLYLILGVSSFTSCSDKRSDHDLADQVTIYRDIWGIPHVHGKTDQAAIFGLAYAYAEDHFPLIERNTLKALGRYTEAYGSEDSSRYFSDFYSKFFQVEKQAKAQYENLPDTLRDLLKAFTGGLNYYLDIHTEEKTVLLDSFESWYPLAGDIFSALGLSGPQYISGVELPYTKNVLSANENTTGSNAWALSPAKTASGSTMLLINPHDPHDDPYYECQLISDEGLNFYGVLPYYKLTALPDRGFNPFLGWALTFNYRDNADAYRMSFDDPDDPLLYRYGGDHKKADTFSFDIRVNLGDSVRSDRYNILQTIHGPVLSNEHHEKISYRLINYENGPVILEQTYAMIRATHFKDWKKGLDIHAKGEHNIMYADRDGNIFFVFGGRTPVRDPRFNWLEPVDGSDPNTRWQGYHPMEEMPWLLNPEAGYIQNCNQSPFYSTHLDNPDPDLFPAYIWKPNRHDNPRAARSRHLLAAVRNVTLDDFHEMNFDTYMDGLKPYILQLEKEWSGLVDTEPQRYERLKEPVLILSGWDLRCHRDSLAPALFIAWNDAIELAFKAGEEEGDDLQVRTFEKGLSLLEKEFGTWKVHYSQLIRVQRSQENAYGVDPDRPSYPTDGISQQFGTMFRMEYPPYNGVSMTRRVHKGNTFIAHIEFTPDGPVANSILAYGNSGRTGSPHFNDQTEKFALGKMKKVHFKMEDILAHLEKKYRPGEEQ